MFERVQMLATAEQALIKALPNPCMPYLLGELSWVEGRPRQADQHIIALAIMSNEV